MAKKSTGGVIYGLRQMTSHFKSGRKIANKSKTVADSGKCQQTTDRKLGCGFLMEMLSLLAGVFLSLCIRNASQKLQINNIK
jgi:hypothetical protein